VAETEIQGKLVSYVRDAHAMEQNVMGMLDSMIRTTEDLQIKKDLEHHQEETRGQIDRLSSRIEALGGDTSTVKDVGAVMGALVKGLGDVARTDKASKNARDGFVTEHLEIASYQLLERLAQRAGDMETAEVARQNRDEEEAMAAKIAATWDKVIDLTLAE
jgi:ferritin-like metal-binding protein YciE